MDFVLMHETVTKHDAIGNDIELMSSIINKNHRCVVFANNRLNDNVEYIEEDELEHLLDDPKTTVIYHHSVRWDHGYDLIKRAKGTIIFRYHNITPENFFRPYNQFAYEQCRLGREQTETMKQENPDAWWLSDSVYNSEDLKLGPKGKEGICPPFNKIEEWSSVLPDEDLLRKLIESDCLNALFVGRIAPNKGHLMLLKTIRDYCAFYDQKIRLRVIGKFDEALIGYNDLIKKRIAEYGIKNMVEFVGEINDSTLMAYYLGSDVMLCCSEHEGFCVPVIEAQSFGLPVVAIDNCAVPETMGENQLVFPSDDRMLAAALRRIRTDAEARTIIRQFGLDNYYARFTFEKIKMQFEKEIKRMTGVTL